MKGLLLKDLYMVRKYCRSYLLISVVFLAVSFFQDSGLFFFLYPCLMCGMIPVSLLSYDEKSHWTQYSQTLPCTKAQVVSGKYLIGLMIQLVVIIVSASVYAVKTKLTGAFQWSEFFILIMILFLFSTVTPTLSLPLIFKTGVEKGRVVYLATIGFICAILFIVSGSLSIDFNVEIRLTGLLPILSLLMVALYVLSWFLSISFYQKREV